MFPQSPDALVLTDSTLTGGDTFATIRFTAKVLSGFTLEYDTLPIVVAYTDSRGTRKGVAVDVPLRDDGDNAAAADPQPQP
jgi:hypothetical protein